ncbi:hypothetical protein, partial [Rhodococcus rhodnii]
PYEDASVDQLSGPGDPNKPTNQVQPERAENEAWAAAAERAKDNNSHRRKLVTWTMWAVSVSLLINAVIFCVYMGSQWGQISDAVMIAWITATVVEVLGIAYIITSDLFKDGTRSH